MITKRLRISDGDFSTLANLMNWLNANGPFADDIDVSIEGGATFGDIDTIIDFSSVLLNGHTITFRTATTELATSAIINGTPYNSSQTNFSGKIIFKQLISTARHHRVVSTNNNFEIRNCVIHRQNWGSPLFELFAPDAITGGGTVSLINNCSLFIYGSDDEGEITEINNVIVLHTGEGTGKSEIKNSTMAVFTDTANCTVTFNSAGAANTNNRLLNYGSKVITVAYADGATAPNLVNDIAYNLIDDPILTKAGYTFEEFTSVFATALNVKLTASSTTLIGRADVTTSETVDINGTARGQSPDIGPYQLSSTPPVPVVPVTSDLLIEQFEDLF